MASRLQYVWRKLVSRCMVLAFALGLAGCGGGGGGAAPAPEPTPPSPPAPTLTLLAGDLGGYGNLDGSGAAASFRFISAVAVDRVGNAFVADGSALRRITPAGVVTTVVASLDGLGLAFGAATDSAGNVFLSDATSSRILKVAPDGIVSTYAGTFGKTGTTDGFRTAALFTYPSSLATDLNDNLYVLESPNRIRKISPAGQVSTLIAGAQGAGGVDGPAGQASFSGLGAIVVDAGGNLLVTDTQAHTVRKITPAGMVSTVAGLFGVSGNNDGVGSGARFLYPSGVAVDLGGSLFVADLGNSTIRRVTPAGVVSTLAGKAGVAGNIDGKGDAARFHWPQQLALTPGGGVFVVDEHDRTSVRFASADGEVRKLAGSMAKVGSIDGDGVAARFASPRSVVADAAGNAYVLDQANDSIRKLTPGGSVSTLARLPASGSQGGGEAPVLRGGLALEDAGALFLGDRANATILKISAAGVVAVWAGKTGQSAVVDGELASARFAAPGELALDHSGNLYVADGSLIRRVSASGAVSTVAGSMARTSTIDGRGASAGFSPPSGLALDKSGAYLYVAEAGAHVIRRVELSTGLVSTVAGVVGLAGTTDGAGVDARFNRPGALTVDESGNIFVADTGNNLIRKITPAGLVSTLAGTPGKVGFAAGALPGVLREPVGIARSGTSLLVTMSSGVVVLRDLP